MSAGRLLAGLVGVAVVGAGAIAIVRRSRFAWREGPDGFTGLRFEPPLGTRTNVTDRIAPAAPDTNDPAPPGSPIVGVAHSGFPAEENRLQNLDRRWDRLVAWGVLRRSPPRSALEAWDRWKTFGVKRELRSMAGWTRQFEDLIAVEDWAASRGFVVHREDSSHMSDAEWEAATR